MRTTQSQAFKVKPIAAGCAVFLLTMGNAYAQAAPAPAATTVDTVTVTGIRKGIEDAISVKKNSDNIVEAISAEDIGKLPDTSIAESIARLPGLTAQRVNGRATSINIRGLSGDFATALLNGREQTSTGDNRGVEFDQYPSELLAAVLVYKTPDAALIGQGLSGTVDLQTVRPLSFAGRTIAANLRHEKNGVGTEFPGSGDRFNISYIDQFADRTIGVALGFARLKQTLGATRNETYDTTHTVNWDGQTVGAANGTTLTLNQGFKLFNDSTTQTRDGAMGVFEFKPSKTFSSTVDIFYSKFDKEIVRRGLEVQVEDSWKGAQSPYFPTLTNPVITDGRLISGVWGNVNPLSRHIWEPTHDKLTSIGWNSKLKFADQWSANLDISTSSAKRTENIIEMEAGLWDTVNNRPLPETVTIANYNQITAFQFDSGNPQLVRLTDPESWGQNGYDKIITTNDKINALRLSARYEMSGFLSNVDFGFNATDRKKTKTADEYFLRIPGGTNNAPLPAGTTSVAVGGSGFNSISFDPGSVFPSAYNLVPNVNGDILKKGWTVKENVNTFYTKGEIDTEIAGFPIHGNVGIQVVRTDQSSTAPVIDNSAQSQYTLTTKGKTFTDVLPSLNLAMDLGNDQHLRLGLARVLARARMDQLSAWQRSEVGQDSKWTGSGGNPYLDPFRADAVDLSYEKYFGTKGYISIAGFYKNLKSYVFDFKDTNFDFTGFPNLSGRVPSSNFGEFTQPRNGAGGRVSGIELAVSVPLNLVTPILDGFGVVASYSDTSSAIHPFGAADTRPLPGLSKQVYTLTAYYEKYGYSARIAQRHRSDFIGEIEGFGADRTYTYIKAESVVDLQFGYEFTSGMLKGLSLLLQINNATNAKYQEYQNTPDNITKTDKYGKTILFGGTFKF